MYPFAESKACVGKGTMRSTYCLRAKVKLDNELMGAMICGDDDATVIPSLYIEKRKELYRSPANKVVA